MQPSQLIPPRLRTTFATFLGVLALAAIASADTENPLLGTWYLTGFESEVNPPDSRTGQGSGNVLVAALPIRTVEVSEPAPGTLHFVFRRANGTIFDTEENTFARVGDFFESTREEGDPAGNERERFGIQLIRDGLALVHTLGGWLSADDTTLWDAWTAAAVLTREPLPKVNPSLWTGPYAGSEWIYGAEWNPDGGTWSFKRESGTLSVDVGKAGTGYRLHVRHDGEEADDIIPAKASGSFLAIDFQEKGGTLWDDEWSRGTLVLDREFYRVIQVSPHEAVVLGVAGAVARVTPKQVQNPVSYTQTDFAESNIIYLVSTANFAFEGQALSLAGPDDVGGPFTARGLPAGMQIDRDTGALTGFANVKPGNYAITRISGDFTDTVYVRVKAFPAPLLAHPDSPTKLVHSEYEALFRDPVTNDPVGKLELKLAAGGHFTGKLLTGRPGLRAIRGRLAPSSEGDSASVTLPLSGDISLQLHLSEEGGLSAELLASDLTAFALAAPGDFSGRVRLHSAANPAPGAQPRGNVAYTLALSPADDSGDAPVGHGWAAVNINPAGLLAAKGKLADGRPFTGSLRATTAGYLAYFKPYANVIDAYLAGRLALSPREGGGQHVATASDGAFVWSKPAPVSTSDRVPAFGPVALVARLEPWTRITTDEGFFTQLDVSGNTLAIVFDGGISETEPARPLPRELTFAVNRGAFSSSVSAPLLHDAPSSNTKAWAKVWKLSLNLANGTFTGHFVLSDVVAAPTAKNPDATRTVTRRVPFSGVLLNGVESPFALGQYVVPDLVTSNPSAGGAITLGAPLD
jgi:hypothetical protein